MRRVGRGVRQDTEMGRHRAMLKRVICQLGLTIVCISVAVPAAAQNSWPLNGNFAGMKASNSNTVELHVNNLDSSRDWALINWGSAAGAGSLSGKLSIFDNTSGADRVVIDPSGRVGIGTANPVSSLHVVGASFRVESASTNATEWDLENNSTGGRRWAFVTWGPAAGGGSLVGKLSVYDNTAGDHRIVADATGNVGIGSTSQLVRLHVLGDTQIDGNIGAKYQDIAEWVRVSSALLPATVVVIDSEESDRVALSSKPYDTRVAGVVSAKPGVLLGAEGPSKAKIAHSGRVRVKVDASHGPISVGDLLVTSPTPG